MMALQIRQAREVDFRVGGAWSALSGKRLKRASALKSIRREGIDDASCLGIEEIDASEYLKIPIKSSKPNESELGSNNEPNATNENPFTKKRTKSEAKTASLRSDPLTGGAPEGVAGSLKESNLEKAAAAIEAAKLELSLLKARRKNGLLEQADFDSQKNDILRVIVSAQKAKQRATKVGANKEAGAKEASVGETAPPDQPKDASQDEKAAAKKAKKRAKEQRRLEALKRKKQEKQKSEAAGNEGATLAPEPAEATEAAEAGAAVCPAAWKRFGLHGDIGAALARKGFLTPTAIQAAVLPAALGTIGEGPQDVVGAAQTGSGKTLAYGLPMLDFILRISKSGPPNRAQGKLWGLVLCPTRELALQVSTHLNALVPKVAAAIVGGLSEHKQLRVLNSRPPVVVATPGRLWELMRDYAPKHLRGLGRLRFLVLDEADRLVQRGSFQELDLILEHIAAADNEPRKSAKDVRGSAFKAQAEALASELDGGIARGALGEPDDDQEEDVDEDEEEEEEEDNEEKEDDDDDDKSNGSEPAENLALSSRPVAALSALAKRGVMPLDVGEAPTLTLEEALALADAGADAVAGAVAGARKGGVGQGTQDRSARDGESEEESEEESGSEDDDDEEEEADGGSVGQRQCFIFSATMTLGDEDRRLLVLNRKQQKNAHKFKTPKHRSGEGADALLRVLERVSIRGEPFIADLSSDGAHGSGEGSPGPEKKGTSTRVSLPPLLELRHAEVLQREKDAYAYHFLLLGLEKRPSGAVRSLVFVNSIASARRVAATLTLLLASSTELAVVLIHAEMQQRQRLKALDRFKKAEHGAVLVATDVAARGLDVPNVAAVLHYDLPRSADAFVHRSGRTARAGQPGEVLALVSEADWSAYTSMLGTVFGGGAARALSSGLVTAAELEGVKGGPGQLPDQLLGQLPGNPGECALPRPFAADAPLLKVCARRAAVASQIAKIDCDHGKSKANENWFRTAADAMEIVLDDAIAEQELDEGQQQERRRGTNKGSSNRGASSEADHLRLELARLLAVPARAKASLHAMARSGGGDGGAMTRVKRAGSSATRPEARPKKQAKKQGKKRRRG